MPRNGIAKLLCCLCLTGFGLGCGKENPAAPKAAELSQPSAKPVFEHEPLPVSPQVLQAELTGGLSRGIPAADQNRIRSAEAMLPPKR